jgi:hypothetical protein
MCQLFGLPLKDLRIPFATPVLEKQSVSTNKVLQTELQFVTFEVTKAIVHKI